MSLMIVLGIAALAVVCSPVLVRVMDRAAGVPLGLMYVAAASVLAGTFPTVFTGGGHGSGAVEWSTTWVRDFPAPGQHIDVAFRGDALSVFFAMLALCVGAVVFIYSASYLHHKDSNTSFYVIMSAFMLAVLLLVLANDIVVLFIAWEFVSIGSFFLIARAGSGGEAGAIRTLVLTFTGGLSLLAATAITATAAGTTDLHEILESGFWVERPGMATALAVLFAVAAFTKSAQLPFHFWLPEAMAAATPVSAFLHAAAVVKAGVYVLLRFSAVFHDNHVWNVLLIVVGMSTAVMASLFAIQKTDLKKLTAYSTVSHLGWIVATIGVGTPFALAAAAVHTLAHAMFKSSLFMLIGVIDHQAHSRDVRRLGKMYKQLPFTFTAVVIGALSMAAIPPMFGFVSKEAMLEAFTGAPLANGGVIVLLIAAFSGAVFTMTYSTRLVFGAFVDGPRDMSEVREAPVRLWLPAALPGVASLPIVFFLSRLDSPIDSLVAAAAPTAHPAHLHLALWHGITLPFLISAVAMCVALVMVAYRHALFEWITPKNFFPTTGNDLLNMLYNRSQKWGRFAASMADSLSPSRHLTYPLLLILYLAGGALLSPGSTGIELAPRVPGIDQPMDVLPLIIVIVSVLALVRTHNRLLAVVLLGIAGIGVTLQILLLGAPDVALTQFLVELLIVVVMMMVVRFQPTDFIQTGNTKKFSAGTLAVLVGVVTFIGVYALVGRHGRPDLAMWYLQEAPGISGGSNVVNTILVEFRALDTMGELSVLGMAGVVIAAVVGSIPRHSRDEDTPPPFGMELSNSIPLRTVLKVLSPVLLVLSFVIFMRGHNAPGGGFIAALVSSGAIMLAYLSKPADRRIVRPNLPFILTGVGMLTALGSGFLGLLKGSFLFPIHGHIAGEHVTTSMIFDVGVFLAVLGMVTLAINALGGTRRPGVDKLLLPFIRSRSNPLPASDLHKEARAEQEAQTSPVHSVVGAQFTPYRAVTTDSVSTARRVDQPRDKEEGDRR